VSDHAVECRDLVVRYGTTTAVDGVSLTVPRGRVLALLGHNGAGKTSLLQVCEGFRAADGGECRVLGLDPIREHDALMPRLGIMLQSGGFYPWATAAELLHLYAAFSANPINPDVLLDRLGLRTFEKTRFRRLSGGEQQRLSLAIALVGRPELVFLDEPTAGMDTEARHTTWQLIEELRADGVSVLLTTHLLDEAERLADDVAERSAALRGDPDGQTRTVARSSHIEAFPPGPIRDDDVIAGLTDRLAEVIERARVAMGEAAVRDSVSEDLLIDVVRTLEKQRWMLRAQLAS